MSIRERIVGFIDNNLLFTATIGAIVYSAIYGALAAILVALIIGIGYILTTFLPIWAAATFATVTFISLLLHLMYFCFDDGHREMRNRIRRVLGGDR